MTKCKNFTVPGGENGNGGDNPKNPDDPQSPNGPNIKEPTIIAEEKGEGFASVTFGIKNDGDQEKQQSITGSIDIGKTGSNDATRETIIDVPAQTQVTRKFEFDVQLDSSTEARICVEKT